MQPCASLKHVPAPACARGLCLPNTTLNPETQSEGCWRRPRAQNTGGKTAALKALGLAALMARAGLFLPVTAGAGALHAAAWTSQARLSVCVGVLLAGLLLHVKQVLCQTIIRQKGFRVSQAL